MLSDVDQPPNASADKYVDPIIDTGISFVNDSDLTTDDAWLNSSEPVPAAVALKMLASRAKANIGKRKGHRKYTWRDWVFLDEERTVFDAQVDMGFVEEEREGESIVCHLENAKGD